MWLQPTKNNMEQEKLYQKDKTIFNKEHNVSFTV